MYMYLLVHKKIIVQISTWPENLNNRPNRCATNYHLLRIGESLVPGLSERVNLASLSPARFLLS